MSKTWRSAPLAFMAISVSGVLVWAGALAYRWFEAYRLGKLLTADVTSDDIPGAKGPGNQRMQAWRDF